MPFSKDDANRVEYQSTPELPTTYYEWFNMNPFGTSTNVNWIKEPTDPFNLQMQVQYGPITLWDVDSIRLAKAKGVDIDDSFYHDAWWFQLTTKGSSISMAEGNYVIQYMAIENPSKPGEYEQFSCVNQYERKNKESEAEVYNYFYNSKVLTNSEVERNGDNINY